MSEPAPAPVQAPAVQPPVIAPVIAPAIAPAPAPAPVPAARQMPARGHSTAPTFDGNPLNLGRFFEEVEILAADARLDDAAKIKHSLRYASLNDYELWVRLPSASGGDFPAFKKAVLELYPGTEDDHRYTMADLDRLTQTQAAYGIQSRAELGEYYREFIRITGFLLEKGRISARERNIAYENGFDPEMKSRIKARLQYMMPEHFHSDPYDFQTFHDCAHFILAGTAAEPSKASRLPAISTTTPRYVSPPAAAPATVPQYSMPPIAAERYTTPVVAAAPTYTPIVPKTEPIDPSVSDLFRLVSQQLSVLTQTLTDREKSNKSRSDKDSKPSGFTPSNYNCLFCDSPNHHIRDCPICDQYIRDGICQRNEDGRIVLPNGRYIPKVITGKVLKERFDKWHAQYPGNRLVSTTSVSADPAPVVSSNFVSISDIPTVESDFDTEAQVLHSMAFDTDDTEDQIKVLEAEVLRLRKRVRFDGVEVPSRNKGKAKEATLPQPVTIDKPASTKPTTKPITPEPSTSASIAPSTIPRPPSTALVPRTSQTFPAPPSQYRYQAPIEDPGIAKAVVDRALDSQVCISQRELLAMSSDARRHMKDLTTSKKISHEVANANTVQNFHFHSPETPTRCCPDCQEDIPLVIGRDSVPLRAVYPVINDKYVFENVLDQGCMIVSMGGSVWAKLGYGLENKRMRMQSANNTKNDTLGCISNVKFSFGNVHLYLQVQVVDDAPYEILLGRPFFALAEALTKDYPNGEQLLTITDPNSKAVVTLPTIEHSIKNRKERSDTGKPDF